MEGPFVVRSAGRIAGIELRYIQAGRLHRHLAVHRFPKEIVRAHGPRHVVAGPVALFAFAVFL